MATAHEHRYRAEALVEETEETNHKGEKYLRDPNPREVGLAQVHVLLAISKELADIHDTLYSRLKS